MWLWCFKRWGVCLWELIMIRVFFWWWFLFLVFFRFFFIFFFGFGWRGVFLFFYSKEVSVLVFLLLFVGLVGFVCLEGIRALFFLVLFGSFLFFLSSRFLFLFISFEFCLFPVIFIILVWGSQPERLSSIYYFLCYSLISSFPFIVFLRLFIGPMSLFFMKGSSGFLFWGGLMVFLVKFPLFGFHFWLPKAHVEAPSLGSIVLAGLLLKLGCVGLCRLLFFRFRYYFIIFFFLSFLGMFFGCFICSCQRDGKALIAYSSICHINFMVFRVCFYMKLTKGFSYLIMFCHGLRASLFFWLVGFIFHYVFSRRLYWLRGLGYLSLSFLFCNILIFVSNFGFPPSLCFFQELVFIYSLSSFSWFRGLLFSFYILIVCYYSLYFLIVLRLGEGRRGSVGVIELGLVFLGGLGCFNIFFLGVFL